VIHGIDSAKRRDVNYSTKRSSFTLIAFFVAVVVVVVVVLRGGFGQSRVWI
jgi:hypothetical protein